MNPYARMVAWVHRSHAPLWHKSVSAPSGITDVSGEPPGGVQGKVTREIVDPIICPECCDRFATAAQFYFHHCPADQ